MKSGQERFQGIRRMLPRIAVQREGQTLEIRSVVVAETARQRLQ